MWSISSLFKFQNQENQSTGQMIMQKLKKKISFWFKICSIEISYSEMIWIKKSKAKKVSHVPIRSNKDDRQAPLIHTQGN